MGAIAVATFVLDYAIPKNNANLEHRHYARSITPLTVYMDKIRWMTDEQVGHIPPFPSGLEVGYDVGEDANFVSGLNGEKIPLYFVEEYLRNSSSYHVWSERSTADKTERRAWHIALTDVLAFYNYCESPMSGRATAWIGNGRARLAERLNLNIDLVPDLRSVSMAERG